MNIIDKHLSMGSMNMNNYPSKSIIHHLEAEGINWTVEQIHTMHVCEKGFSAIGYHYYIRLDGTIYKGRPDNAIGAHCQGYNTNTLGIAFEGNYDERPEMPSAQFNSWCELNTYLRSKYGNMEIYGHREKGSSECPGALFPLDKVKNANKQSENVLGWNHTESGWWYCLDIANVYYYRDCWQLIDGDYYSFDHDGYARSSTWIQDMGRWYYLRSNCVMAKDQWLKLDGEFYCFDPHGGLYLNCVTPDGYKVDDTGAWIN